MTNEEKILQYLKDNGVDLTKYVITYAHEIPGTVVIVSRSIWGYGGNYKTWEKLLEILKKPCCPVRMHSIDPDPTEIEYSLDRLIWTGTPEDPPDNTPYKIVDHRYETATEDGGWREDVYFTCGKCGEDVIGMDEHMIFVHRCPHCNALIDWDGWWNG